VGPGWNLPRVYVATVAYGRVVYVRGNTLRVRPIRGGADRRVLALPGGSKLVAAGSFGVALAVQRGSENPRTSVHRIPWRTIDAVLPRR
jgi:hypothetical protein